MTFSQFKTKQIHKIHIQAGDMLYSSLRKHETISVLIWHERLCKLSKQQEKPQSGHRPPQAPGKSVGHEGAGLKSFGYRCMFFEAQNRVKTGDFNRWGTCWEGATGQLQYHVTGKTFLCSRWVTTSNLEYFFLLTNGSKLTENARLQATWVRDYRKILLIIHRKNRMELKKKKVNCKAASFSGCFQLH